MAFKLYPEIKSDTFYDDIYKKKEFLKTRVESNFLNRKPEDVCKPNEFKLDKSQEFVRNFISFETPYNGILLFHGTGVGKTCAAISITEGLRDYVYKMGKKIYIISSEHVRENFYNELYNPRRAKLEHLKHSAPGSYQCAGNRYHISETDIPDEEYRNKKIRNNIKKYYEFMGQNVFSTFIEVRLKKMGLSPREIAEKMVNSVIVIDEAHGIVGRGKNDSKGRKGDIYEDDFEDESIYLNNESELIDDDEIIVKNKIKKKVDVSQKTLLNVLLDLVKECRKIGGNLKIILLTATPMKDEPVEIADLLELLNLNDGIQIDRNKLFPTLNTFDSDYLAEISKGYVSYVRGNNPISFPEYKNPPLENLYEPNPLFDYSNDKLNINSDYNTYLDENNTIKYKFNLYKCPMSMYQFKILLITKQIQDTANKNGKQCVCFVYPGANINTILLSNDFPLKDKIKYYSGINGFKSCFKENLILVDESKNRKEKQYEIKKDVLEKYGYFIMLENDINPKYNLSVFSAKFAEIIKNINSVNGIAYCFCEYGLASAVIFALCLEANGYIKYDKRVLYDKNGLPINLDNIKTARMLNLPYLTKKNYFRCAICGKLYNECIQQQNHKFKQATYIIKTGILGNEDDIENITQSSNKYGHNIKVLIGSKVTGEGLDLKWVRQIHIIDPWHNNTRIYQIIGRGIRNCSHIDLEPTERNVTVYKYSATVPILFNKDNELIINTTDKIQNMDAKIPPTFVSGEKISFDFGLTYRQIFTETVDELLYKRIINKDFFIKKIERVLKTTAIDCEFNKNINNYWDLDVDFSRECDYNKCKYKCIGYNKEIEYIDIEINFNSQKIKSLYFFKDNKPHKYYKLKFKPILINIIDYFNINKSNISNENNYVKYSGDLINKLRYYLINKGAYIDNRILRFEIPNTDVDISTYNIHFAQPQINRAQLYIRQLFQHNLILKEKNIIDLIHDVDPNIDVEFIRTALDQLVGNEPYISPMQIKDKYNRLGYILYVNEFYLFHPNEIENKKIPFYYKNNPLQIKKTSLDINNLIKSEIFKSYDKDVVEITDKDKMVFINMMETMFKKIEKSKNKEIHELISMAKMRYYIDSSYTLGEQESLFKYILLELKNHNSDSLIYKISDFLIKYYKYLFLIHIYKNTLYLFFNSKYALKYDNNMNKFVKIILDDNDPVVNDYNEQDLTPVNNVNSGLYGFLANSNSKFPRDKKIYTNKKLFYNRTINTIDRLNRYIKTRKDIEDLKFKFNNKNNENIKNTGEGDLSKKTFTIGLTCSQNLAQVKELFDLLHSIYRENVIMYNGNKIDVESLLEKLNGKFYNDCFKIAILLKILDIVELKNVRWFLSPFETEYFIPLNNIDNILF